MPPRTRSTTGALKKVARYVESADSLDLELAEHSPIARTKKSSKRTKSESESESDFDMSDEGETSESSDGEFVSSVDDHRVSADPVGSSVDDFSVDLEPVAPKPVKKKMGISALPENGIIREGRLTPFPPSRLNMSYEEILDSITSQLERNSEAACIVGMFRTQYKKLTSEHSNQSNTIEKELPCHLMYHMARAGVVDVSLFQTNSFVGLDNSKLMLHYERIKSIVLQLIRDDIGKKYEGLLLGRDLIPPYVPWWT
jgi:hypothetical protein